MKLTQTILKDVLTYNQETGIFIWKVRDLKYFKTWQACNRWNARYAFEPCGCISGTTGYIYINLLGTIYAAHRLAFLYIEGTFPPNQVDHINQNKTDNEFTNLRKSTARENRKNMKKSIKNSSGVVGVSFHQKANKWQARISDNGKPVHLGLFLTKKAATVARMQAEVKYGYSLLHGT